MRITVPIYVNQRRRGQTAPITARPVFFASPEKSGAELGRVIAELTNRLRVHLSELATGQNQEGLLRWHQADSLGNQVFKSRLDLRDSTADFRVLLVSMVRNGTRVVFSPNLPNLWFDVRQDETVFERARDVYESHFRAIRKEDPTYDPSRHNLQGKAWIDYVTVDLVPTMRTKKEVDPLRAFLGGDDVSDGAAELRKTSRCLNWVDSAELADPIGVDKDVQRLTQLLQVGDRRGIVLVGPSGSGKTARIEGAVRQRLKRSKSAVRELVWHLSPARLISGMSYLGQWQERVLSIFRHAHRYDHVLYFDDMLGLFEAGKTRDSVMCVADTLRAQLDVYPFRVLAEMTPEAWAIFRERDRALADRFVVMPTEARDADQSLEIMLGVQRNLESRHRCRFEVDVIPEVISIYDRFERSSVLPGKAVAALQRLASRNPEKQIDRRDALAEFQSRSGLEPAMIDQRMTINRELVERRIRREVVGQENAVDKLIDRILVAASRMNDTSRPLGTFLLVGPTGVGKTQLAKAVAKCLFDEDGLIRLDMNELSSPASASRLVGTFDNPDGLLTSAVRRRPNAVLLLDEIEKAHPSVLDVLLQALGEARLSDARGRTVDLSGLLILMTSNLGTRESQRGRGFSGVDDQTIEETHLRAVREFFRPEFFNRIDDVLSFHRLSSETMQSIALMQFKDVLRRDGLQRRSILIDVDPNAIRQTAQRGYNPDMGARALKRQIERDLVRPAAEVLAASKTDQPTMLRLYLDDSKVQTRWQPIQYEKTLVAKPISIDQLCERAEVWLSDVAKQLDGDPLSFEVGSAGGVDVETLETMTLRDSLHQCQETLRDLIESKDAPRLKQPTASPPPVSKAVSYRFNPPPRAEFRDIQAIDDIEDYLRDSLIEVKPDDFDTIRDRLIDQCARLHQQLQAKGTSPNWLIWIRWFGQEFEATRRKTFSEEINDHMLNYGIEAWACGEDDLICEDVRHARWAMTVSGALSAATVQEVSGGWMFVAGGHLRMADVRLREYGVDEDPQDVMKRWKAEIINQPISTVRRIIHSGGPLVDLRTGAAINESYSRANIEKLLTLSRRDIRFLLDDGEVGDE